MQGLTQFLVYMAAALLVFTAVLALTLRRRGSRPVGTILLLSLVVVGGGMTFARVMYGRGLPWWIFYGIPAALTLVLPPMALRMSRREFLLYGPLAILMAPAIHVVFSFCLGWHDYMPLFYVPHWRQLFS